MVAPLLSQLLVHIAKTTTVWTKNSKVVCCHPLLVLTSEQPQHIHRLSTVFQVWWGVVMRKPWRGRLAEFVLWKFQLYTGCTWCLLIPGGRDLFAPLAHRTVVSPHSFLILTLVSPRIPQRVRILLTGLITGFSIYWQ